MAKKSFKLVKASAALAVTAAALTPVMAAEASTAKAVELKAEVVLGGKFKEALALNTPAGVQITWGKHLVTAINKWQTVTGKGSDGKTYIKKLYARNYPLYVLDQDLGEVEAGSELVKPSIRVMYRDGKVYTQAPERYTMSSNYNTKDEGEQKVLISYNHNGNRITKLLTYTVVAGEVEFANVASSVDQAAEVLSVTADVKNLKEGEKVELVVYPGKDTSATPIKETATVKEGKLSVSKKLPAGTHSFQLVSGDVKSEIKEFTIEAPMVKEVKALNSQELTITFNKPIDKASVITTSGSVDSLKNGVLELTTVAGSAASLVGGKASLNAAGTELTVTAASGSFNGKYVLRLLADQAKTTEGKAVAAYTSSVFSAEDTVRPTFTGLSYKPTGEAVFSFSEPLNFGSSDVKVQTIKDALTIAGPTVVDKSSLVVTVATDNKSFEIALPEGMTLDANYTFAFTGLKDFANNIINPNPVSVNVVKSVRDNVRPTVVSVTPVDVNKVQVAFSEKVRDSGAQITVNGVAVTSYELDSSKTVATFDIPAAQVGAGVKTIVVSGARDLANNVQDGSVTRVLQFVADTQAPAYVKHEIKTEGSNRYLVVTFDEKLSTSIGSLTGTYVDANSITRSIESDFFSTTSLSEDRMSVKVLIGSAVAGTYNLNLPQGFAVDASSNANRSVARSISFVLGGVVDATKPTVTGFAQSLDNKKITVGFSAPVTAATALNLANYSIDGVVSPFESAIFAGNSQTVELTLRDGVLGTNGFRNYSIRNVATPAGAIMDAVNTSYNFTENVRPTVTAARLIAANQVEITLSEAINTATVGGDFQVFRGTSTTALAENGEASTSANKVVITLSEAVPSLDGLVVKPESTLNLADVNGNLVNFSGSINVTN